MALNWTCESVRLSLFSSQAVRLSPENWTALSGQEEAEQEQKGTGRHVFAGPMLGGQFTLGAIANRCDCILGPVGAVGPPEDGIPSVGAWPVALEGFQKLTEPFLEKLHFPVTRMALAPVLVHPFHERIEAYTALMSLLKSIKQPADALHDLLFRVNWPTDSAAVHGLSINRLTTWSVLQYQIQVFAADGPTSFMDVVSHGLRLEMDHNTDQKYVGPFDAGQLVPIYKELTNLALQNAAEGEVL
ncbi:hypothetical protein IVA94_18095 [Bradyrhizobium sp. 156]|uniref:hypothetical protein n=1 Tax=Bradyrhizobium sp. 156 TaxID=2782630 RepID=UPI001FF8383E|nr:hypothetical protein [Bradyrhizobium sp. 156]MCK1322772.1 hypothetical protein [Bradyrhizobium sp. 156]